MKIGIDARFLTHPQMGGFKTYSENLVAGLANVDADNEYILYLDRPPSQKTLLPNRSNFTSCIVPGLVPGLGMPWREQVGLARQIRRDNLDLFHALTLTAPLYLSCPLVLTIHDMIWSFPERFASKKSRSAKRKFMEWYYRLVPRFAARQAAAIVAVSQASKESIVQHLGLEEDHVFVTHEAASPIYRQVDDAQQIEKIRRQYELPDKFVLAIGSADPRKNITTLLKAYALLPVAIREEYKLAVVWTHEFLETELAELVAELGLSKYVQFLRQVSNEDLVLVYNAASLFVFPSLYEGFGLTLLEAMACGAPVVAADNSSIPEIIDDAALLVNALDAEAMAGAIRRILTDKILRSSLTQKGLVRATSFSWDRCARQTIGVYEKAVGNCSVDK
ncbi:mannosyl-N-acetyl-alpha-D-glucosaminyl-diphospho-ditrans,octacis-undecaprenol 3-alpha-mannosyltransferase / alpha-1,3-rhamnosyltransferase [Anaerolineae bacterium]|nr:mannosyl-N-acetyl-alpha-D-glucosaminyl-diphospho-ditrans,octacis-undecaprenol 3-alpha-mannosyltransferase / alpha-1,3-rhamnosyltransferase [Anaerolineae bacterium]